MIIERTNDPERIRPIWEHDSVQLERSVPCSLVSDPTTLAFVAEYGAMIFWRIQPGEYGIAIGVLPAGRTGTWSVDFSGPCLDMVFEAGADQITAHITNEESYDLGNRVGRGQVQYRERSMVIFTRANWLAWKAKQP